MTKHKPMTREQAQEWVDALDGPYANRKGEGQLCDSDGNMCCLGVLAELNGKLSKIPVMLWSAEGYTEGRFLLGSGQNALSFRDASGCRPYLGLSIEQQRVLAGLNDVSDTFAPVISQIKDWFIDVPSNQGRSA